MKYSLKKICLIGKFAVTSLSCLAQDSSGVAVKDVMKITFLDPGLSYEKRLGKKQTLLIQTYFRTIPYLFYQRSAGYNAGIYFNPAVTVQYRYYYNGTRRAAHGKRTEMNSLNYVAPTFEAIHLKDNHVWKTHNLNRRNGYYLLGAVWGLQRNYAKRFSLDLNIGLGYYTRSRVGVVSFSTDLKRYVEQDLAPTGKLSLGFWLNRRKYKS